MPAYSCPSELAVMRRFPGLCGRISGGGRATGSFGEETAHAWSTTHAYGLRDAMMMSQVSPQPHIRER
eukprot:scaffold2045_cov203-Alexandrium_tamarense.AAC.15